MDLDFLTWVVLFIVGLAVGSFLGVVIDRLPRGESVLRGRSYCEACGKTLRWFELIPLASFVLQAGRCRSCGTSLSLKYPVIELGSGLLTVLVTRHFFFSPTPLPWLLEAGYFLIFTYTLVVIAGIDLKSLIIPDRLLIFLLMLFAARFLFGILWLGLQTFEQLFNHVIGAGLASLFFYFLIWVTKGKGMGGGDLKLGFVLGLFLTLKELVVGVYLAFLLGGMVGLILLLIGKKRFGQVLPFGPFLALGAVGALLWSQQLTELYLRLLYF